MQPRSWPRFLMDTKQAARRPNSVVAGAAGRGLRRTAASTQARA